MKNLKTKQGQIDDLLADVFSQTIEEITSSAEEITEYSYENDTYPVDIVEFMESGDFLGLRGQVYAEIKNMLIDIEQDSVREAFLILGKGSGKSLAAQIFSAYGAYTTHQLKNPQATYGLTRNTSLFSLNVSISKDQAKDVIFAGIADLLRNSPYFNRIATIGTTAISLPKKIYLKCGHSNSTAFLGYPTLRAVMDEANYMVDNNNRNVAQQLYSALKGSLKTRFPNDYKLLCISSDSLPHSFMRDRLKVIKDSLAADSLESLIDVN